MKNIKQEIENEQLQDLMYDDLYRSYQPKQGLSGKKHCICSACDIFGCDPNCSICKEYGNDLDLFKAAFLS